VRYREGALLFYAILADRLLPETSRQSSVQLIVPEGESPPEEDCLAIASAIARKYNDALSDATTIGGLEADPLALPDGPLVIDCRKMTSVSVAESFLMPLNGRRDIVLIAQREIALLGMRVVSLRTSGEFLFSTISEAFSEVLSSLKSHDRTGNVLIPARFLSRGLRGVNDDFAIFDGQAEQSLTDEYLGRFCSSISRTWEFRDRAIGSAEVVRWVRQFEQLGVAREAMDLLNFVNRMGYLSKGEIVNKILGEYRKVCDSGSAPKLTSIQSVGKSESMLYYDLREIQGDGVVAIDELTSDDSYEHISCCDDVIGSGETMLECLFEDAGSVWSSGFASWLSRERSRFSIVVALASAGGIRNIEADARCLGKVKVYAAQIIADNGGVFAEASGVFTSREAGLNFHRVCKALGMSLYPTAPLGWCDCEWAIVTSYNTPDCSLPVLWSGGDDNTPWEPLFPRR